MVRLHPAESHKGSNHVGPLPFTRLHGDLRALAWVGHRRALHHKGQARFGTTAVITSPDSELVVVNTGNPLNIKVILILFNHLFPVR